MRKFVERYNGYNIFLWSTGKYEGYIGSQAMNVSARSLDEIKRIIDTRA